MTVIGKFICITAAYLTMSTFSHVIYADDNLTHSEPGDELFIKHTIQISGYSIPYSVFVSPHVDSSRSPPIILAFHGSGERGSDGILNTRQGIGPALRSHANLFPCIVVIPQLPTDHVWSDRIDLSDANSPTIEDFALAALEETIVQYSADRSRVYITGNSLGGFATYELASAHPNLFAAALPVSGGGNIALATGLENMPIWSAHGFWDHDVKISLDRNLINAIRKTGNKGTHFSIHWFSAHNVWDKTYSDPKIMTWLFQQKLGNSR